MDQIWLLGQHLLHPLMIVGLDRSQEFRPTDDMLRQRSRGQPEEP